MVFIHGITAGTAVASAQASFTEMKTEIDICFPGARERRRVRSYLRQTCTAMITRDRKLTEGERSGKNDFEHHRKCELSEAMFSKILSYLRCGPDIGPTCEEREMWAV